MSNYSAESYQKMFDALLSQELCFSASAATNTNILDSMKRILGRCIKQNFIRCYSNLVLDESLNVHFSFVDADNTAFDLILYYEQ